MKYRIVTNSPRFSYPYSVEYLEGDLWRHDSLQTTIESAEQRIKLLIDTNDFIPQVIKEYGVAACQ